MTDYLSRPDFDFTSTQMAIDYDQNSNWSPYFGELIFANVPLRKHMRVLDVGCGTGYPGIELSQRLGPTSEVIGIDIWEAGLARARQKASGFNLENVSFLNQDASATTFADGYFDLIVCNVGVNNFDDPAAVFHEWYRVSKPDATIALTTNPNGHMQEFYRIFENVLRQLDLGECLVALERHEAARHSVEWVCQELERADLATRKIVEDEFSWRFLDGTAFLNTFHIGYGFLPSWKALVPSDRRVEVFGELEANINAVAQERGCFEVSIPVRYVEATQPQRD